MLTPKQHALLVYIDSRIRETGVCPSLDEIAHEIGMRAKSGVHAIVKSLIERGYVRKGAHRSRCLEVVRMPGEPRGVEVTLETGSHIGGQWLEPGRYSIRAVTRPSTNS